MVTLTFRTTPEIDKKLNIISELSSVTKSSFIVYAINEFIRLNNPIDSKHTTYDSSVRMTIRISDDIDNKLTQAVKKANLNKNGVINHIVNYYIENIWSYYFNDTTI